MCAREGGLHDGKEKINYYIPKKGTLFDNKNVSEEIPYSESTMAALLNVAFPILKPNSSYHRYPRMYEAAVSHNDRASCHLDDTCTNIYSEDSEDRYRIQKYFGINERHLC